MKERDAFNKKEKIKWLYEKIRNKFEENVVAFLKKEKILPEDKKYDIAPDFDNIEKWQISTISHKDYTTEGPSIEKENIKSIKGFLCITKGGLNIDPSFPFEFKTEKLKFSFNPTTIREIIKRDKQKEDWSIYSLFGKNEDFTVFDKEREKHLKKLKTETQSFLHEIGFSKDESNLMVLGALKHRSYTDNITPEGLTGIALKVRGETLLTTK